MKKSIVILSSLVILILSSCGFSNGLTRNFNDHSTQVQLSKNNYKVIKSVRGSETATYFLGIGGLKKEALVANARANMLKEAGLEGTSRAVINETVEFQTKSIIIYTSYTVTVSAYIIEFTS